jgi:hypothetical protein
MPVSQMRVVVMPGMGISNRVSSRFWSNSQMRVMLSKENDEHLHWQITIIFLSTMNISPPLTFHVKVKIYTLHKDTVGTM